MRETLVNLAYLLSSVLFIFGIKMLSSPRTAVKGNQVAALGMLIAIVVTFLDKQIVSYPVILAGIVVGSLIGYIMAVKTPMTGMPQMVALLNGSGGLGSVLVAGAVYHESLENAGEALGVLKAVGVVTAPSMSMQMLIATILSGLIGAITFTGSMIAFSKLQDLLSDKAVIPARVALNVVLGIAAVAVSVAIVLNPEMVVLYWALVAICSVLGVTLVIGIGGADMPVAISLLNSYSGMAACATGFVLNNTSLIISGALVGASGIILTNIMCKAMNRSLLNVLAGGLSAAAAKGPSADEVYKGKVKSTSPEEIAMLCEGIRRFVVVPGYGMAVAQAQHAVRDMAAILEEKGIEVEYAIHPVAGRMPGHMNVLLAEADIPYDKLKTMEEINPTFAQTDIVMVIGANDVVNPDALNNPQSPIAGMPILEVHHARTVIVVKRSLSPGYAGIPNPLFAADNCLMFFADGKKAILDIIAALKEM
jgi:NAD(P) transhydrogenase subunit beta